METKRATNTHQGQPAVAKKMEILNLDVQVILISKLKPVVPDDKIGVAIVDAGLHRPLPPLDVASPPHQRCHRPLPGR